MQTETQVWLVVENDYDRMHINNTKDLHDKLMKTNKGRAPELLQELHHTKQNDSMKDHLEYLRVNMRHIQLAIDCYEKL